MVRTKTIEGVRMEIRKNGLHWPPGLSNPETTVIHTLAKYEPTNAYQIAKKIGKGYSVVFNALKQLKERRMVILKEKRQTEKGTTANIYDLSLKGVLFILRKKLASGDTDTWDYTSVRKTIHKYGGLLPLVFGKWEHFKRMDVEKMALIRLKIAVDNFNHEHFRMKYDSNRFCWFFYSFGFYPYRSSFEGSGFMEDPRAWLRTLKQDEEIRVYVLKILKNFQKRLETQAVFVKGSLSFLESISDLSSVSFPI